MAERVAIKEPWRGHLLTFFTLAVLLLWEVGFPANLPPRTVTVKIAADSEFMPLFDWQTRFYRIFNNCSYVFRTRFGIQLEIKKFVYWKLDCKGRSLREIMLEKPNIVNSEGNDILLGICSPRKVAGPEYGLTDFFNGIVLVEYLDTPKSMECLLLHEFCHLFGAVDVEEKGSVMTVPYSGTGIDGFTSLLVSLNQDRAFRRGSLPWPRSRLNNIVSVLKGRREIHPKEIGTFGFLASLLLESEDYESTAYECEKALGDFPGNPEILTLLGNALQEGGEIEGAISRYREALCLQPENAYLHCSLGLAYLDVPRLDEAIDEFRRAAELLPAVAEFHYNLGVAYEKKGELESAAAELLRAISLNKDCHQAYTNLGSVHLKKGMIEEGIAASRKALEIDPDDVFAWSNLGWAYTMKGLFEEAVSNCEKAIVLDPLLPEPHNFLGVSMAKAGRLDEAEKEYLKAVALKPDYGEAHFNLGSLYLERNLDAEAMFHFRKVLEIDPTWAAAYQNIAQIYFRQEKYPQAWRTISRAEKMGLEVQPAFRNQVLSNLR
jgi:tetratricopeptide (TPR) repeat protein